VSDEATVEVRIPTILRTYTGGATVVQVHIEHDATVAQLIDALEAAHPGIRARVLDETGALRRFVNIYVGEEDIRFDDGLATAVVPGTSVSIIPAVAGG